MNTLIIYDSAFGNTRHIAQTIAQTLKGQSNVAITSLDEADQFDLKSFDLLIVGCPTQRHSLTLGMRAFLDKIPRGTLDSLKAAAFDTRYRMSVWISGSAAWSIGRHLQRAGATLITAPESFFVENREGPLEEGELKRAEQWATTLLQALEAGIPVT